MKIKAYNFFIFICFLLIGIFLLSCLPMQQEEKEMPSINSQGQYEINIRMGESAEEAYRRNPNMFEVNESGLGPGFMRPVLSSEEIQKIKIVLFGQDYRPVFDIDHILDVRFVHDANIPFLGVNSFLVDLPTVDVRNKADQEKIYQQYAAVLKKIRNYGWKAYITPETPRVFGKEKWESDLGLKDGFYIDSFEKWKEHVKNNHIFVMFYNGNLIMGVSISSGSSEIEINTAEVDYLYRYDEETRIEHWREYLQRDIPLWRAERAKMETELKEKGVFIDENYVDAPLPQ